MWQASSVRRYSLSRSIVFSGIPLGIKAISIYGNMDQVEQPETLKDLHSDYQVQISAKTGAGLDELKDILEMILRNRKIYLEKVFSYQEAGRIQTIRKYGQLLKEEYREDGIYVEAYVPTELYAGLMR